MVFREDEQKQCKSTFEKKKKTMFSVKPPTQARKGK